MERRCKFSSDYSVCSIATKRSGAFTSGITIHCDGTEADKESCPIWSGKCVFKLGDD